MTLIDLRLKYKRLTGYSNIPISHEYFGDVDYILWLESELIKLANLKNRLLPWESLEENPKLIHK